MSDDSKRIDDLEVGHAELRVRQEEMKQDITEIKLQVTNHLPHQIAAVQDSVNNIAKKHESYDAIFRFISACFKAASAVAVVVWTAIQVIKTLNK